MSVTVPLVNVAANATFTNLVDTVNLLANTVSNYVLTVNTLANGSISTGNGFVNGMFGANTLFATNIRGGNVQTSGPVSFLSNVAFNANVSCNTTIYLGNTSSLNSSTLFLGNSIVNAVLNTTSLYFNNVGIVTTNTRASILQNSSVIGVRGSINFITSGAISINSIDNANTDSIDITLSASGNSIVAGSDKQIQYNANGSLSASLGLTFDSSSNTLSVSNTANVKTLSFQDIIKVGTKVTNSSISGTYEIDNFLLSDFSGGEYLIVVKDNANSTYQTIKSIISRDNITEYGTVFSSSDLGNIIASSNSTHVIISLNTSIANTTTKIIRTLVAA
jgi:hypothetical protein